MTSRWWLWIYVSLLSAALALSVIGISQSCPDIDGGFLTQGCDHSKIVTAASGHGLSWLLISGAAAVLGTAIALVRRRRPSFRSFVVWSSAGVLELSLIAAWYISPGYLAIALLIIAACAVLAAVPAGVSLATPKSLVDAAESSATTTGS